MTTRLAAAFEAAERDGSCRALLVTGAGRGFCAGQDLSERSVAPCASAKVDVGHSIETRFNPLIRRLCASRKPSVVALNVDAAGPDANELHARDIHPA